MLRKETVTTSTLELLKNLMADDNLRDFYLVGGTALSLQIGHRISIDIDLFSEKSFDENIMSEYLETQKGLRLNYIARNTIKGQINDVQVDLITHAYQLVDALIIEENTRMAGLKDIAAMKLNAIVGNGTRVKDFIDIAFLSTYFSLTEMVSFYEKKYRVKNPFITLKALSYREEVNFSEPIRMQKGAYSWKPIEQRITQMLSAPDKLFSSPPL
jgi:hypothetical protein